MLDDRIDYHSMSNGRDSDTADATDPAEWWNEVYGREANPPWDTGEPQPALVDAVERYGLSGRVLDAGCGTGTHALWAVARGHAAVGVDFSEEGVERAREKAAVQGLDVTFRVADLLDAPGDLGPFDTVLDSGLFHAFETGERERYARELARLVRGGGLVFLVGFAEGAREDAGPNPFTVEDVAGAFEEGWEVLETREVAFETTETSHPGLLAVVERV